MDDYYLFAVSPLDKNGPKTKISFIEYFLKKLGSKITNRFPAKTKHCTILWALYLKPSSLILYPLNY